LNAPKPLSGSQLTKKTKFLECEVLKRVKLRDMIERLAILLLALVSLISASVSESANAQELFSIPDLGIQYVPPTRILDGTSPDGKEARKHALANSRIVLILDMASHERDTAPNWRQLWIFLRPRAALANLSESAADAKMNTVLAGPRSTAVGSPHSVVLAGHNFVVSEFQQSEPPLLKHAKLYTTSCKGQLVTLVFVSNSAERLSEMEDSLKSLKFSAP
jgi:hypothetical protein